MYVAMHMATTLGAGYRRSLEAYTRAGIRHVELIAAPVQDFVRRESVGAARRLLSDLGLTPVAGGSLGGLIEPRPERAKAAEEFKRMADLFAKLGVDRFVFFSRTAEQFTITDYERAVAHLRQVGDIARNFGMTAMLEFVRGSTFVGTLPTALRLTRAAAHPNVKPMLDFYHFFSGLSKLGDLDLLRTAEIGHVHVQDVPDCPRELLDLTTREVPGEGVAPLVHTLKVLQRLSYAGPLSVELVHPKFQNGDPFEVSNQVRRSTEAVLEKAGLA